MSIASDRFGAQAYTQTAQPKKKCALVVERNFTPWLVHKLANDNSSSNSYFILIFIIDETKMVQMVHFDCFCNCVLIGAL